MAGEAPSVRVFYAQTPVAAAITDDLTVPVFKAPWAGTITAATYVARAALSGANTNSRTLTVVNHNTSGTAKVTAGTLALVSGVNLVAFDEKAITLSGTAANVAVLKDEIISFESTHVGNGLTDPGGLAIITLTRVLA